MAATAAAALWSLAASAAFSCVPTPTGVRVDDRYELSVARSGFRLGVGPKDGPLPSPMLSENVTLPGFTRVRGGCGITSDHGALVADIGDDGRPRFVLMSPGDEVATTVLVSEAVGGSVRAGFTSLGGAAARYYGTGGAEEEMERLTSEGGSAKLFNRATAVPYYFCTAGYAVLAVVAEWPMGEYPYEYPVAWRRAADGDADWRVTGRDRVDFYLLPAASMDAASQAYWDVVGAPAVLPKYAFGYHASRWGWETPEYITGTLQRYREEGYPLDVMIMDFEWFTDSLAGDYYFFPTTGTKDWSDFGYNKKTLPRPRAQLAAIHASGVDFGGMRKPRLGNAANLRTATRQGWILPSRPETLPELLSREFQYNKRLLNFTNPALRDWYAANMAHYLDDGVDFFWNDEGEFAYFMYHYWTVAQHDGLAAHDPDRRFFALNRAFTPGNARYGVSVWTGDQHATWHALQLQPGYLLTWQLGGMGYVTCDVGGFSEGVVDEELLVRWYQVGAFMSYMKVHSALTGKPHFPFLWSPPAAAAMQDAMLLRYRLTTFFYSLAHKQYAARVPIFRAVAAEFPDDARFFDMTSQWLAGTHLMAAPVLHPGGRKTVLFPALHGPSARWYRFNATTVVDASEVTLTAALDAIPLYVRSGGVLPINPDVANTKALPGGPLEVQVYAGEDGTFTLYEDDGRSNGYKSNAAAVRATTFSWDDGARTLTWRRDGGYAGADVARDVYVVMLSPEGRWTTAPVALEEVGAIEVTTATASVSLSLRDDAGRVVAAQTGTIAAGWERYPSYTERRVTVRGDGCELRFTAFDVEDEARCRYDAVEVFSGSALLGRYCGARLPQGLVIPGGSFTVALRSDARVVGSGFALDFACNGTSVPPAPIPAPERVLCDERLALRPGASSFACASVTRGYDVRITRVELWTMTPAPLCGAPRVGLGLGRVRRSFTAAEEDWTAAGMRVRVAAGDAIRVKVTNQNFLVCNAEVYARLFFTRV
eukprot:TRINITY_DN21030_c0_g1_i1.p1 TRINITY_DN21030_c0_g1~~TRINITY_DN21030_c0_g1_i1.p1  ORF type:complete len:991 (+),score=274.11 TRINITY_DN21030_c0_g1_i1:52-3024(+)